MRYVACPLTEDVRDSDITTYDNRQGEHIIWSHSYGLKRKPSIIYTQGVSA